MNDQDVFADGSELLTRSARRSRTGVLNSRRAGRAATSPVANSATGKQADERQDRSVVPCEREVRERAVAGGRIDGGAGGRNGDGALVDRLVVRDRGGAAGVARVTRTQFGRGRPAERAREGGSVV